MAFTNAAAIVLAAGTGERLGHAIPKAFVLLRGVSLLERSVRTLEAVSGIDRILPVVAPSELDRYAALGLSGAILQNPAPGGEARQDSVLAGLRALPEDVAWVAVHDAARCLVTVEEVTAVLEAARETGAAILARPASDTIKRVRGGFVEETPPREECWAAQTPQVFRRSVLQEAVEKAVADGFVGTDDAQLVARMGVRVRVVRGRETNLKITEPGDLALAESVLVGALGPGGSPIGGSLG
jgi:2-C-methyl-D-erythritol 4-phosphate cytidylyltransferase